MPSLGQRLLLGENGQEESHSPGHPQSAPAHRPSEVGINEPSVGEQ